MVFFHIVLVGEEEEIGLGSIIKPDLYFEVIVVLISGQ